LVDGAVGDASQAPGDIVLGDKVVGGENGILLNVLDLESFVNETYYTN